MSIDHEDATTSEATCQLLYANTLALLHKATSSASPLVAQAYTRELFQTQGCDSVANLVGLRADLEHAIGKGAMQRLITPRGDATREDLVENFHAVRYYFPSHKAQVLSAMRLSTRIWVTKQ